MSWTDLLWFPPVMLAIGMVLGAASAEEGEQGGMGRAIVRTSLLLAVSVICVGLVIHVIANVFSG